MVGRIPLQRVDDARLERLRQVVAGGWDEPDFDLLDDGLSIVERMHLAAANDSLAEPDPETTNPAG
jgi:hypothetical protein